MITTILNFAGIIFIGLFIYEISNAIKSILVKNWPLTDGKLHKWNIKAEDQGEDTARVIDELVYKYEVKGKGYESNQIGYGFPMSMSVLYVDKTLNNIFETAPNLTVYYNPKKPDVSVLTVGLKIYHVVKMLGYLLIIIVFYVFANNS